MAKENHRQSKIPPVIKHMLYTVDVGSHKRLIGSLGTRWGIRKHKLCDSGFTESVGFIEGVPQLDLKQRLQAMFPGCVMRALSMGQHISKRESGNADNHGM